MREFSCPDPRILTGRGVIEAFLAAFGTYKGRGERVVCRHLGVDTLGDDPNAWFPVGKFLAAMSELQDQFGAPFMRKVGSFTFDKVVFPPGIDDVQKAMQVMNAAYYTNHRDVEQGQIGGYHWKADGERGGVLSCDNPYPCAFDIGITETIARRFSSNGRVGHEAGTCRHRGDDVCHYRVEW